MSKVQDAYVQGLKSLPTRLNSRERPGTVF